MLPSPPAVCQSGISRPQGNYYIIIISISIMIVIIRMVIISIYIAILSLLLLSIGMPYSVFFFVVYFLSAIFHLPIICKFFNVLTHHRKKTNREVVHSCRPFPQHFLIQGQLIRPSNNLKNNIHSDKY